MIKIFKYTVRLAFLTFLLCNCKEDETIFPDINLAWQPSTTLIAEGHHLSADQFFIGENKKLYVYGNGTLFVFDDNNTWNFVSDLRTGWTFKVQELSNRIYACSQDGLYQVKNDTTVLIHAFEFEPSISIKEYINDMEVFDGKLLINGYMKFNGTLSSVFSYDGTSFASMSNIMKQSNFIRDDDSLYIKLNNDLYKFHDNELQIVKKSEPGEASIYKVHNGEIYSVNTYVSVGSYMGGHRVIQEDLVGNKKLLANLLPENINLSQICFVGEMPVVIGYDYDTGLSVSYFLQDDEWNVIPTGVNFNSIVEYQGRILATTYNDSGIVELVKQP